MIDAVSETHHLLFLRQQVMEVRLRPVDRLDFEQHLHYLLVGPAVQRSLECADGARNRRVYVRKRRSRHAGDKRRGVVAVVGVQDQSHVKPARVLGVRRFALQHVKKVGGVIELGVRSDGLLAFADAAKGGNDRAHLSRQAQGFVPVRLLRRVFGFRIV